MRPQLRRVDLCWAFATPIYWILGTLRHEGSHALAGLLCGARIRQLVVWPSKIDGLAVWGYVRFDHDPPSVAIAGPFIVDVLAILLCTWICVRLLPDRRALWINVFLLGVVSPQVDLIYNFVGPTVFARGGDVAGLVLAFGPLAVYPAFLVAIVVSGCCLALTLDRRPAPLCDPAVAGRRLVVAWFTVVAVSVLMLLGTTAVRIVRGDRFGFWGFPYHASAATLYVVAVSLFSLPLLVAAATVDRRGHLPRDGTPPESGEN